MRTHNRTDLSQQIFGRFTVIAKARRNSWLCRCTCGTEKIIFTSELIRSKSCGCLLTEMQKSGAINLQHGENRKGRTTPEYNSWRSMRERCLNPQYVKWHRYGGRGITICEHWNSYENFLADMGRKPSPKHSLDRINNDGNYEPSNCRWATNKEQADNRPRRIAVGMHMWKWEQHQEAVGA